MSSQDRRCELFDKRGFHDWRYLGWPLTNPSCYEHWCSVCGLRQVPRRLSRHTRNTSGEAEWVDDGFKEDKGCLCQLCSVEYKVDVNIPDDLWAKIHENRNLLCGSCIIKQIERLDRFEAFTLTLTQ